VKYCNLPKATAQYSTDNARDSQDHVALSSDDASAKKPWKEKEGKAMLAFSIKHTPGKPKKRTSFQK
jgi:hypothetical protein